MGYQNGLSNQTDKSNRLSNEQEKVNKRLAVKRSWRSRTMLGRLEPQHATWLEYYLLAVYISMRVVLNGRLTATFA